MSVPANGSGGGEHAAAGSAHTLLLKADGTVWLQGIYHHVHDRPVPVTGLTEIVAIGAGPIHNLAVAAEGTVWAWSLRPFAPVDGEPGAAWWRPVPVAHLADAAGSPPALGAIATVSARHLSFRDSGAAETLTITNVGLSPLVIEDLAIAGEAAADFAITDETCSGVSIYPGSFCTIRIRFAPQAAGRRRAHLAIGSNALGGPVTVALSGGAEAVTALAPRACSTELSVPCDLAIPVAIDAHGECDGAPLITCEPDGDSGEPGGQEFLVTIPVTVTVRTEAAGRTQLQRLPLALTRRVRLDPGGPGRFTFLQHVQTTLPLDLSAHAACRLGTAAGGDDR